MAEKLFINVPVYRLTEFRVNWVAILFGFDIPNLNQKYIQYGSLVKQTTQRVILNPWEGGEGYSVSRGISCTEGDNQYMGGWWGIFCIQGGRYLVLSSFICWHVKIVGTSPWQGQNEMLMSEIWYTLPQVDEKSKQTLNCILLWIHLHHVSCDRRDLARRPGINIKFYNSRKCHASRTSFMDNYISLRYLWSKSFQNTVRGCSLSSISVSRSTKAKTKGHNSFKLYKQNILI